MPASADPRSEYSSRLQQRELRVSKLNRRHIWIGNFRILVFIIIAVLWWRIGKTGSPSIYWLVAAIAAFIALIVIHTQIMQWMQSAKRAAAYYSRGLARMEDRWAGSGETGEQFRSEEHVYADDLDILGPESLYQLLCSARTRMGKEQLAQWLLTQASVQAIGERQGAVRELASKIAFREDLAVIGKSDHIQADPHKLAAWANQKPVLDYRRWWPWIAAWSLIATGTVIYGSTTHEFGLAALAVLFNIGIGYAFRRPLQLIFTELDSACRNLEDIAAIVRRIEAESFQNSRMQALRQQLMTEDGPPSKVLGQLDRLYDLAESRANMFVQVFNLVFLYGLHVAFALERWRTHYSRNIEQWLQVLGEVEALASIGAYAFEHPEDPFPEFAAEDQRACYEGESLGHPLLPADQCVRNSVSLGGHAQVLMVSGSNMSGKSTLLRVVGINAVLAMMGAPVRAHRLLMTPAVVGASMRISDSLRKGVSHFYAEISRIRDVVTLAGGRRLLFLFDEILQGTNSHDRRAGTEGILKTLLEHDAIGLVTTHDLALTSIAEIFPEKIRNVHFQEKLETGKLLFDYQLRDGVVTTSNGVELMRSVGLDV